MDAFQQLAWVAGGVIALALALAFVVRRRRRDAARPDLGAFLRRCEQDGTPPEIAAEVFHALQRWRAEAGISARADDDLARVYGIEAGEQEAVAAMLLRRCGRRAAPGSEPPRLSTAADLARYVASCPPESRA
ncbi:MAG TPA: hypothetical protein VFY49_03605 [Myxococcota bacterium]|nr:hypothetical protein [Myxococcota bacterium]